MIIYETESDEEQFPTITNLDEVNNFVSGSEITVAEPKFNEALANSCNNPFPQIASVEEAETSRNCFPAKKLSVHVEDISQEKEVVVTRDNEFQQMEIEVDNEQFIQTQKNRRKSYSSSQKLKVVSYAEVAGNRQAARWAAIDESCIRKWRLNKELLIEINSERGTKRKPNLHWPSLDMELKSWVLEQMKNGVILKPSAIKTKSIELAKALDLSDFKGTSSYIFKFMERYKIPGRQTRHSAKKLN